jgi:hypothetical protein
MMHPLKTSTKSGFLAVSILFSHGKIPGAEQGIRSEWHFPEPYVPLSKRALALDRGSLR